MIRVAGDGRAAPYGTCRESWRARGSWGRRTADAQVVLNRDQLFNTESLASSVFDSLRGDPRFHLILRRLNLDPTLLGRRRG